MDKQVNTILPKRSYWMDERLLTVRHNEFAWRATPPETMEDWEEQRDFTRGQLALAAGLSPMPKPLPLNPEIWGKAAYWGVVIKKVRFETMPGLACTGNLFMPAKLKNKAPGILAPHSHYAEGRVHHDEDSSLPLCCIMLARLGFVVFSYDMIGMGDSNQLMHEWPLEIQRDAALHGVSPFGLQTWISMRAIDFLCGLPDVDSERLGMVGEGAGAVQGWTVAALDDRIKVLAVADMLSSHFQGECACEEGPLMRLNGVTSFDILTACAPRPVFVASATNGWSNLNASYEIEALKQVYQLFDAEDALLNVVTEGKNNFNVETRQHIYPWFTHWLLNQSLRETIQEDNIPLPPMNFLLHPEGAATATAPAIKSTRQALEGIKAFYCEDAVPSAGELEMDPEFRGERIPLLGEIINNDLELADIAVRIAGVPWKVNKGIAQGQLISRREEGDVIPAIWVEPDEKVAKPTTCLLLSPSGKADFFHGGEQSFLMEQLLDNHCECLAMDMMGCGETAGWPAASNRDEKDPLFFAFNPSVFSMRVQDVLTALAMLKEMGKEKIVLIATGEAARVAAIAAALAEPLKAVVLNLDGVDDTAAGWSAEPSFQPMILKVGGILGALSIVSPRRLLLFRANHRMAEYLSTWYELQKKSNLLTLEDGNFLRMVDRAVR